MASSEKRRARTKPWKHTERDRGYTARKAAADERARVHRYDPERCKPGCAAKPTRKSVTVKWADHSAQTFERVTYFTDDDWAALSAQERAVVGAPADYDVANAIDLPARDGSRRTRNRATVR